MPHPPYQDCEGSGVGGGDFYGLPPTQHGLRVTELNENKIWGSIIIFERYRAFNKIKWSAKRMQRMERFFVEHWLFVCASQNPASEPAHEQPDEQHERWTRATPSENLFGHGSCGAPGLARAEQSATCRECFQLSICEPQVHCTVLARCRHAGSRAAARQRWRCPRANRAAAAAHPAPAPRRRTRHRQGASRYCLGRGSGEAESPRAADSGPRWERASRGAYADQARRGGRAGRGGG